MKNVNNLWSQNKLLPLLLNARSPTVTLPRLKVIHFISKMFKDMIKIMLRL